MYFSLSYLSGAMTNPNCEYSLNIPAMVTLAEWAHNPDWDQTGHAANSRAVKEFLLESAISSYDQEEDKEAAPVDPENELRESDVDLIFQMFWLPHSHGPKITELLENFQFCKENAAVVRGWKKFDLGKQLHVSKWTIITVIFSTRRPARHNRRVDGESYCNKQHMQTFFHGRISSCDP